MNEGRAPIDVLRAIITDVEEMRGGPGSELCFGPFNSDHIEWANLAMLIDEAKASIEAADKTIDGRTHSICEAVADLAMNFAEAESVPNDSRETIRLCIEWACEFDIKNSGRQWDGEYMDEIDDWFRQKYSAWLDTATDVRHR